MPSPVGGYGDRGVKVLARDNGPHRQLRMTDRPVCTPDRPHLGSRRRPAAKLHYVRDWGLLPSPTFYVPGNNRLATPGTASGMSIGARMHHVRRPRVTVTPPPSLMGATKILNGIPDLSQYQSVLPPDGGTVLHPGRLLPGVCQTTQALFGAATCKAGTTQVLRRMADLVPPEAPRYLTHDATAMSSSLASVYRKTNLGGVQPDDSKSWSTSYTRDYPHKDLLGYEEEEAARKAAVEWKKPAMPSFATPQVSRRSHSSVL